jgi:hypothetical protein
MKVKHKVTGKVHDVSEDYFSKYEDRLQVLELVDESPVKKTRAKKQTKVVIDDSPAVREQ